MTMLDRPPQPTKARVAQPASPHVIRPRRCEVRLACVTTLALRKPSYEGTGWDSCLSGPSAAGKFIHVITRVGCRNRSRYRFSPTNYQHGGFQVYIIFLSSFVFFFHSLPLGASSSPLILKHRPQLPTPCNASTKGLGTIHGSLSSPSKRSFLLPNTSPCPIRSGPEEPFNTSVIGGKREKTLYTPPHDRTHTWMRYRFRSGERVGGFYDAACAC